MILAIGAGKLFLGYIVVIAIIVFFLVRNFIKKNSTARKNREDRMGELNAFILQYEASKKVEASQEPQTPQTRELDAETIGRIKALYFDAEMPVEKIADKTDVSVEQIKKLVEE